MSNSEVENHKSYLQSKYGEKAAEFLNDLETCRGFEVVKKWNISRQLVSLHKKKLGFKGEELRTESMMARQEEKKKLAEQKRQEIQAKRNLRNLDIMTRFNNNESVEEIAKIHGMTRPSMYQLIMRLRAVNKSSIGYRLKRKNSPKFNLKAYDIKNTQIYKIVKPEVKAIKSTA
jgi:hypothetical protein